jgi:5S rRNA maturation endonuclease (ribonuclease M5)
VAEKLTVRTILQQVAQEFTIPLTISRGMSSLPPKKAIAQRYKVSQKDRLILLVVSDLDPAGDAIAEDLVKSFRRDFNIQAI